MIDVGPIGQQHIGNGASSLVAAVRLDGDFLPEARSEAAKRRAEPYTKIVEELPRNKAG